MHVTPPKLKVSLRKTTLRAQVSASYALMAILPILGLWYLIWAYVDPSVLSQQNTVLILLVIVTISLLGFAFLRGVVKALSDFREHLKSIVDDRILDTPLSADEPADTPPSESLEEIVYNLIKHNSRLSDMFSDIEEVTWQKTRELTRVNLELQRKVAKHKEVEDELRKSNMQLSDALEKLKELQQCIIRHERLSALGQLASGIAHDINNALMPVIGFAELILQDASVAQDKSALMGMVKDILDGAQQASAVVSKLKSFYRRDASLNFVEVNPEELAKQVSDLTRPRWAEESEAESNRIKFRIDAAGAPKFKAEPNLLRDALVNIVMNSIDSIQDGGEISLTITGEPDNVLITVKDNGSGMKKYVQEHCMEPFFTTKGKEATGMGLAIAYGTVRRHSGTIEVNSSEKSGTSIMISIPLDIAEDEAHPSHENAAPRIDPLKLLVIDDDERSRMTMETLLKPAGHEIITASNGHEGINKTEKEEFDVIITDRAMPDLSGDEVAEAIHQTHPDVPILMVTGFGDIMHEQKKKPKGVSKIISKPVDNQTITWALYELTQKEHRTT